VAQRDPTDLQGQEQEQEDQQRKAQQRSEQEVEDFKWLMDKKQGRRVVWRLLEKAGVFRTSFSTNALQMALGEGNRSYGLFWLNEVMTHCPEKFLIMINESKNAS
jgi:hypothetical protein